MKLSVFCVFCVIIPSWTQDYCWPHNIQVCRHFLVSSLVTASVLFGYFGCGYCMFNFVGEIWNCRNWKSQPSSKFKICNFPCHPYHLHFTLGWENSKPPLQNKCRLRSYLKRLCSCPCSHIAERTLETHLNIPPGQLIGSRSQMVSYECPLEDTAGWIKAILIKVPL